MHDLRHAHASWLLAGGADLKTVMDRLGHTQISTTQRYLHALASADDTALEAFHRTRGIGTWPLRSSQTPSQTSARAGAARAGRAHPVSRGPYAGGRPVSSPWRVYSYRPSKSRSVTVRMSSSWSLIRLTPRMRASRPGASGWS